METDAFPLEFLVRRVDQGAARPIFVLATATYGVAVLVAAGALAEQLHGFDAVSIGLAVLGLIASGAAGLTLVAPHRWNLIRRALTVPALGALVFGGFSVFAAISGEGLAANHAAWGLLSGLFGWLWVGITTIAAALGRREEASADQPIISVRPVAATQAASAGSDRAAAAA